MTMTNRRWRAYRVPPHVLDVDESELIDRFMSGIKTIGCISLALNYPTIVSVTHSLVNAYKNVLAVAIGTEYSFPAAENVSATPPFSHLRTMYTEIH
jgi:hypothetical protein